MILENREIENRILVPIELEYNPEGKPLRVTDDYIDIGYRYETTARILSNLYPYRFGYFSNRANSIEAAIQSLKYKDKAVRKKCYAYSGLDAWHLRGMTPYEWQKDGILYTPMGPVDRFSEAYQNFLDELYFSVFANALYRHNLQASGTRKLDHLTGEDDVHRSTLTRTEYISRLYALRYCINNDLTEREESKKVLKMVREELK